MRIISLRGWFQALTTAGAAKSNLERALELDPITSDETIQFLSYRWRGVAYAKLGRVPKPKKRFRKR